MNRPSQVVTALLPCIKQEEEEEEEEKEKEKEEDTRLVTWICNQYSVIYFCFLLHSHKEPAPNPFYTSGEQDKNSFHSRF